jgi:hypothetical protein
VVLGKYNRVNCNGLRDLKKRDLEPVIKKLEIQVKWGVEREKKEVTKCERLTDFYLKRNNTFYFKALYIAL